MSNTVTSETDMSGVRVLVVDDEAVSRTTLRGILAQRFDVITASSGTEGLERCQERLPDLIVLDIEMPDIDGIEVCRRIREHSNVPIVFATGHQSLEEHLKAYDAGGNDIVTKPVTSAILLRKVSLAIRQHQAEIALQDEKDSLQRMAMDFLSTMGQGGVLLNFMRASMACRTHRELAEQLFKTAHDLGVDCSVMVRHEAGPTVITPHGDATAIELSILEQAAGMGRIFQFRKRMAVNYPRVSIIVANMPDEQTHAEEAGQLRDNIAILAETTEALCENVDMRQESMQRAEMLQIAHTGAVDTVELLRDNYSRMLGDTRILIEEMVDNVERGYAWLGASEPQERELSERLDLSVKRILGMLAEGGDFDSQFERVIASLRGGTDMKKPSAELF